MGGLKLINISDATAPTILSQYKTPAAGQSNAPSLAGQYLGVTSRPGGLALGGNYLYMSDFASKGILVFDVTVSTAPSLVATWHTWAGADYPMGIAYTAGKLWVAIQEGSPSKSGYLIQIDASAPTAANPPTSMGWVGDAVKGALEKVPKVVIDSTVAYVTNQGTYPSVTIVDLSAIDSPAPTAAPTYAPTTPSPTKDYAEDVNYGLIIAMVFVWICICGLCIGGFIYCHHHVCPGLHDEKTAPAGSAGVEASMQETKSAGAVEPAV